MSAKLNTHAVHCTGHEYDLSRSSVVSQATRLGPRQLQDYALHAIIQLKSSYMFTPYAVGVEDIAAREGSPHNVLYSSSVGMVVTLCTYICTACLCIWSCRFVYVCKFNYVYLSTKKQAA